MKQLYRYLFFLLLTLGTLQTHAQEGVVTFGFQFKPLIPSAFFRAGEEAVYKNNVDYILTPRLSYSAGMLIRKGFTDNFSIETGISYVKRNYNLAITDNNDGFSNNYDFSIIGYEIPTLGLLYVRLSEKVYMNTAFGASFDMFPLTIEQTVDSAHTHTSIRKSWIKFSLLANLGFEYRTKKAGIFYLGASFHRPFTYTYRAIVEYYPYGRNWEETSLNLSGNYLTFDLRYFFHEEPEKK